MSGDNGKGWWDALDSESDSDHYTPVVKHSVEGYDYELQDDLIRVTDLSIAFGDKVVLKPTSIDVRNIVRPGADQGQVVGILGPSGVGKTLFSRALAGLHIPTTGRIEIAEINGGIHDLKPVEMGDVGMVAQNYPLFRHRTVLGNLLIAQEFSSDGHKVKVEKARDYLNEFGLIEHEDKYPSQLSGGQRQRVAIARQLLCSKHVLVMDEPTTGLDPIMRDAVCALVDEVSSLDEYLTIFVVSHDIASIVQISDQLWLFGREKDEDGNFIPGATIKVQMDLIERGLAWRPNVTSLPAFSDCINEIRREFDSL